MRAFTARSVLWAPLVACAFMGIFASSLWAGEPRVGYHKAALKPQPPWLMISMSTDGYSRGCRHVYSVVAHLSGNPNGRMLHFSEVTPELIVEMQPEFVVLGPQGTPWCRYTGEKGVALQNFLWFLPVMAEGLNIPILGICGGHQALALGFGGKVGPIRTGTYDCLPYTRERQTGVVSLSLMSPDPIFSGIAGKLRIQQSHFDEVKVLPPGFVLLASDRLCPIQIMRHPTRPVYGIQGHPESSFAQRPEGALLIKNFLKIAGEYNNAVKNPPSPHAGVVSF